MSTNFTPDQPPATNSSPADLDDADFGDADLDDADLDDADFGDDDVDPSFLAAGAAPMASNVEAPSDQPPSPSGRCPGEGFVSPSMDQPAGGVTADQTSPTAPDCTEPAGDVDDDAAFSDEDLILVEALACGLGHAEAGALIHRGAKTVQRRRRSNPALDTAVADRRRQMVEQVGGLLLGASPSAIETLKEIMASAPNPADRTRAAQMILRSGGQFQHQLADNELARRIDELEVAVAQGEDAGPTRPTDQRRPR